MEYLPRMAIFARVVELGAFSRAAKELGLTASSVSQHIQALEKSLGAVLLHRTTRKLSLTEAGRLYYQECVKVVNAARDGKQKVAELRDEPVGELRVAVSGFMSCQYVIPALKDFIRAYSQINLHFEINDHYVDLVEQRIDLALRVGNAEQGQMTGQKVAWFQDVLCASPAYIDAHPPIRTPDDLLQHNFLQFSAYGETPSIELKQANGESARLRLPYRLSANHAPSLRLLALDGHGITRLLLTNVQHDLNAGRLRLVLPEWRLQGVGIYLIVPEGKAQPLKLRRCIEHIRAYFTRRTLSAHTLDAALPDETLTSQDQLIPDVRATV